MRESTAAPQTILFLAANPKNTRSLRLDEELRDIDEGLRRSHHRDQFKLAQRLAVRPRDIQRAMLDTRPQIVHFSGHGDGEEGLVFEDVSGNAQRVSGDALASLFDLFSDQIQCVLLNGCYSEVQAKAIVQHVPYVIGMRKAIGDRAAIAFAVGFYDALGAGESIEFAYNLGCTSIHLSGSSLGAGRDISFVDESVGAKALLGEHLVPVLLKKSDLLIPSSANQQKQKDNKSVRYNFLLTGSIEAYDVEFISSIVARLRVLAQDTSIMLINVESGSIKLVLEGSAVGFERISDLIQSGRLTEVLGIPIRGLELVETLGSSETNSTNQLATKALEVFISFCHKDEALKNELYVHLAGLQRQGKIKPWQDWDIEAGTEWNNTIKERLEAADIILLLVSPRFIASDYCYNEEMQRAMARHEQGTVRVIPIIMKPCDWQDTLFSKLQALPKGAKPVSTWDDQDMALLTVAKEIRRVVETLTKK